MTSSNDNILYEDNFVVDDLNPEGKSSKTFKNIGRVIASGTTYDVSMVVDIQIELFPIKLKDRLTIALASNLSLTGGKKQTGNSSKAMKRGHDGGYDQSGEPTLLDKFDYGMYGKVFKCEPIDEHKMAVYVSYGGLLMKVVGDQRHLSAIELDVSIAFYLHVLFCSS